VFLLEKMAQVLWQTEALVVPVPSRKNNGKGSLCPLMDSQPAMAFFLMQQGFTYLISARESY